MQEMQPRPAGQRDGDRSRNPRRRFLALSAGAAAVLAWPAALLVPGRAARACPAPPAESTSASLRLAALGRRIATASPDVARDALQWLDERLPARGEPERVREMLLARDRRAADFRCGDVVRVDGWILARSEVAAAVWHARRISDRAG